ncbi:hypothetical protein [Pantanalinema sp. GBBB05]|uniref:hypothetical protein n=1 Tax=Pantanalinema sp. GBBB05 TaxID=2604139 RepID=UPI001DDFCB8E|nr:hypothetical protein [Pantanalinema sp. GBBB05]
MKQEVIQDFLNLPGIAGVALMDGRSRPYFCGVDQTLNFQQKEALAQGILQVVETIPEGFESFEFQFTGHQVHIYKLDRGIILLVLTRDDLVYSDYLQIIKNLKASLREDIANAIATFRLIAGNITLSGISYRKTTPNGSRALDPSTTISSSHNSPLPAPSPPASMATSAPPPPTETLAPPVTPLPTAPPTAPPSPVVTQVPVVAAIAPEVTIKDLIAALNHLSKFTTQFLGTHVIVNYWKSTRPNHEWLNNFQVDRSAQLSFSSSIPQELLQTLSHEQQNWIREWITAFIKRCSQVIRDFPQLIEQKALTAEQKALLLGDES